MVLLAAALTVVAMGFVTVRFFAGASSTLSNARENACRSLTPDPIPAALQNVEAPNFELPDAQGRLVSLRAQKGHPVAVNFWATWCPPCVEEVPSLESMALTLEGTDMRLLAVSVDDDWEAIRRFFVKGTKIGILLDKSHTIPKTFGTTQYPETYFLDGQGHVRYYFANLRNWSKPEAVACLESLR
ncbi:MAG TPA: TlpA disulfide reductase family protein [Solirubrobacteraceae bacterium]|jgi:peroxiredoxin|nr:TlpA disulfide reductase family protein [Solirubrobacteraceae bacterium]